MANISIREYIYFLPIPLPPNTPLPYTLGLPDYNPLGLSPVCSEPTMTVVLTTASGYFVDIRIFKPLLPNEPLVPNVSGIAHRLEWAFAGKSSSVAHPQLPSVRHSVWTHWVDSNYPVNATGIPPDEGNLYALPDDKTLEVGALWNKQLGTMQTIEELWSDLEIKACYPSSKKCSVLMCTENLGRGIRGSILRVGQLCQGFLKKGNQNVVERWQFVEEVEREGDEDERVVGGRWERVVKLGDDLLPCSVTFNLEQLEEGVKTTYLDHEWTVSEIVEWED